jgi:multidrug efflux pump subunit AcrB
MTMLPKVSQQHSYTLSTWAIYNHIPVLVLCLLLTIAGIGAYLQLPINHLPVVHVPIISVQIPLPHAGAKEIEEQVTNKVETSLTSIAGLKHISSSISEGLSHTVLEFYTNIPSEQALYEAKNIINKIRQQLPSNILEPIVETVDVTGRALLIYTMENPWPLHQASWFFEHTVKKALLSIPEVANVTLHGSVQDEVNVYIAPDKLLASRLSIPEISRQLALNYQDATSGRIVIKNNEYVLRIAGNTNTLSALQQLKLTTPSGEILQLSDLGQVVGSAGEMRSLARFNNHPAISFHIFRSQTANELALLQHVEEKIQQLQTQYPEIKFQQIFNLIQRTKQSFYATIINFIEGTILTIIVVYLFLGNMRATALAAIAIPASLLPTFLCMHWLHFSFNVISMLAISLVTGVLVDDAIVEIENIYRYLKQNIPIKQATIVASNQIALAVIATSLVICAVFLPVSCMNGVPGQFFRQFGLTVAIAAFFSLLVARLLIPVLASKFLTPHYEERHDIYNYFLQYYSKIVSWTLQHRGYTMIVATCCLIGSFALIQYIPRGFIPCEDLAQAQLYVELPPGTTLETADSLAQNISKLLLSQPEVQHILTNIPGTINAMSGPQLMQAHTQAPINSISFDIQLSPNTQRSKSQKQIEAHFLQLLHHYPDLRMNFANDAGTKDLSLVLIGDDYTSLFNAVRNIHTELQQLPYLQSISNTLGLLQPELVLELDFAKMAALGITSKTISEVITISTIGDLEQALAKLYLPQRQRPIRLRLSPRLQDASMVLANLPIPTHDGNSIPLSAIASIKPAFNIPSIEHYDSRPKITIEANLRGIALGSALQKLYQLPSIKQLPPGVTLQPTGDAETMRDLFGEFGKAIFYGLLLVYLIQVLLYKDWLQPLTRMTALPLSIGGSFLALLLTGTELGLPALIGLLMLMGIADKNSILLVDHILHLLQLPGTTTQAAILEACQVRARPIIMTSLAMLASMLPVALGLSLDHNFRTPMAITVMGGLLSSTALSLIFVPVFFSYAYDFERWLNIAFRQSSNLS